jgi:hypothetical protein
MPFFFLSAVVAGFNPFNLELRVKCSTTVLPGACIIKLNTAVIYGFRNKLECLSRASLVFRHLGTIKVI